MDAQPQTGRQVICRCSHTLNCIHRASSTQLTQFDTGRCSRWLDQHRCFDDKGLTRTHLKNNPDTFGVHIHSHFLPWAVSVFVVAKQHWGFTYLCLRRTQGLPSRVDTCTGSALHQSPDKLRRFDTEMRYKPCHSGCTCNTTSETVTFAVDRRIRVDYNLYALPVRLALHMLLCAQAQSTWQMNTTTSKTLLSHLGLQTTLRNWQHENEHFVKLSQWQLSRLFAPNQKIFR